MTSSARATASRTVAAFPVPLFPARLAITNDRIGCAAVGAAPQSPVFHIWQHPNRGKHRRRSRNLWISTLVATCLALAACGGGESDRSKSEQIIATETTGWSDEVIPPHLVSEHDVYLASRELCSSQSPTAVAKAYGSPSPKPGPAAVYYSEKAYRPVFQTAAFAGCLDGFRQR